MVYDSARNHLVLYGGKVGTGPELVATWAFEGGSWLQVHSIGIDIRQSPAFAYDDGRSAAVLYGGAQHNRETWEWNGSTWTKASDSGPDIDSTVGAYLLGRTYLFGGVTYGDTVRYSGETWSWNGKHWTQVQNMGPEARGGHAMIADTKRRQLTLFGGGRELDDDKILYLGDTWEFSPRQLGS
jgi:hypothetical protein